MSKAKAEAQAAGPAVAAPSPGVGPSPIATARPRLARAMAPGMAGLRPPAGGAVPRAQQSGGLQRAVGNARTNQMLTGPAGAAGAARPPMTGATKPMPPAAGRMIQRKCACGGETGPAGECAACQAKRTGVQRQDAAVAPSLMPASVQRAMEGGERPLGVSTRASMEQGFGTDLGGGRVHTVQRGQGRESVARMRVSEPGDAQEREAEAMAGRVVAGERIGPPQAAGTGAQVQRYSWDEFVGDVGGVVDSATSATASLALDAANALIARLGGTVTITPAGLVIDIPEITLFDNINKSFDDIPIAPFFIPLVPPVVGQIGPLPIVGEFGILGWAQLYPVIAIGPGRVRGIRILINPFTSHYAASGQLYVAGAAAGRLVLFGGLAAVAATVIPMEPPIPLVVNIEGGLRGTGTIWDIGALQSDITLDYSAGTIKFDAVNDLMFGVLLTGDVDLFAAARIELKDMCHYAYRLGHWETGEAYQFTLPVTAGYGPGGGTGSIGPITHGPIPIAAIETAIKPVETGWHCSTIDEVIKELCDLGVIPKDICDDIAKATAALEGELDEKAAALGSELCTRGILPPALCTRFAAKGGGPTGPGGPIGPSVAPSGDGCDESDMDAKIGKRSVLKVIRDSSLGEKIGKKPVKPNQDSVERKLVCKYTSKACRGSAFPPIDLFPGKDYTVIDEGHHRFVASRLSEKAVGVSGKHRPPPEPYDPDKENYPNPFEWKEVEWQ